MAMEFIKQKTHKTHQTSPTFSSHNPSPKMVNLYKLCS